MDKVMNTGSHSWTPGLVLAATLLAGCGSGSAAPSDAGTQDAGDSRAKPHDAGRDTGGDSHAKPHDAGNDTGGDSHAKPHDAGSDVQHDSSADSRTDAADSEGSYFSSYPGDVWEGETHLAVGTNGYVAAVWMADDHTSGGPQFIGYTFSTDSGSSWTPVQILTVGYNHYDPTVAVDAANNFYVSFASCDKAIAEFHLWVATASAGTTTFGTPSEVTDPADGTPTDAGGALYWYDKPWIAVTQNQEIVVTYTRFEFMSCPPSSIKPGATCSTIMLSRSKDAKSWSRVPVSPSGTADGGPDAGPATYARFSFACVSASTSRLWIVYEDFSASGKVAVILQYSDDDGASWSPANSTVVALDTINWDDPSCAGNGSDVWVEYELRAGTKGVADSIQVVHSTTGGQTFGAPVNAQDTPTSPHSWHSTLVLESSGSLDVVYYGGASLGDPNGAVYYVRSKDQGASWSTSTLIKKPIRLILPVGIGGWAADDWLGDYLGVTTTGGSLYTTFTDNSSGISHVDFAMMKLP